LLPFIYLIGGLVLLGAAGEYFVRSAITVAEKLNIPHLIIGLTIIAFGTSLPELMVSIQASMAGQADIAIGNVVGSNIANVLLVLGTAAAISPFTADIGSLRRDGMVMIGASLLLILLAQLTIIPVWVGYGLLGLLILYSITVFRMQKAAGEVSEIADSVDENAMPGGLFINLVLMVATLAGVIIGAKILISGAVDIARLIGVSEAVIGLTMIAIGTSLPELVVSMIAAFRGHAAMAVGNVIGSNIFNILMILGATASIAPIRFPAEVASRDVWIMLGSSALVIYFMRSNIRMTRPEGIICLALYFGYMVYLYSIGA
jgi:cation:H+ antiporter